MEESVKRRDRLKAMRVEASQTDGSNNLEASSGPSCLSNPLMETSASLAQDCSATPRFDFYTDPLSAFSSNKKRSFAESQAYPALAPPSNVGSSTVQFSPSRRGSWNPPMAPPRQFHSNYAHNQRMYPPQAPPYNSIPQGFPNQPDRFQPNPPYPNPDFRPMGRPGFSSGHVSPGPNNQIMYPLQAPPYNSIPPPRGFPNQPDRFQPNPLYPNPGSVRPTGSRPRFNPGQVSPAPNSECGGYPSHSPGKDMVHQLPSHGGRGQGQGSPGPGGPPDPKRLYHKSMLEDPWKFCQPVRWKRLDTQASCSRATDSPQSWLPKSISSNTTRVAEANIKSRSGPSLAASLAASLYETVNETDEQGK